MIEFIVSPTSGRKLDKGLTNVALRGSNDLPMFHMLELLNSAFVRVNFQRLLHAAERGVLKLTTTQIAV